MACTVKDEWCVEGVNVNVAGKKGKIKGLEEELKIHKGVLTSSSCHPILTPSLCPLCQVFNPILTSSSCHPILTLPRVKPGTRGTRKELR